MGQYIIFGCAVYYPKGASDIINTSSNEAEAEEIAMEYLNNNTLSFVQVVDINQLDYNEGIIFEKSNYND